MNWNTRAVSIGQNPQDSLRRWRNTAYRIDAEGYNGYLIAVYLFDETALHIAGSG